MSILSGMQQKVWHKLLLARAVDPACTCGHAAAVVEAQNELTQKVLGQCDTRDQFKWVQTQRTSHTWQL